MSRKPELQSPKSYGTIGNGNKEKNKNDVLGPTLRSSTETYGTPNLDTRGLKATSTKKISRNDWLRSFYQKYRPSLQTMIPVRRKLKPASPNPLDDAGLFSFITVSWLTSLMIKASKGKLTEDCMPPLSRHDCSDVNAKRLKNLWDEEVKTTVPEKASMGRVVLKFQRTRLLMNFLANLLFISFCMIEPVVIIDILHYSETQSNDLVYGCLLCLSLCVTGLLKSFTLNLALGINFRTAIRLKVAISTMAIEKLMKFKTLTHISVGEVINLLSNDSHRLCEAAVMVPLAFSAPLLLIASTAYSCVILGPTALIGVSVYLLLWPIQMIVAKITHVYRVQAISVTDMRVRTMNEVLNCIKLIKMYAWEKSFAKTVEGIRRTEKCILEKSAYVRSVNNSLISMVTTAATVLTFIVHTLLKKELTGSTAFTVVSVFNVMIYTSVVLPNAVKYFAEAKVSVNRFKKILIMENPPSYVDEVHDAPYALRLISATLSWEELEQLKIITTSNESESHDKSTIQKPGSDVQVGTKNGSFQLHNINFKVGKGMLLGICGNVGSGKSSIISALLGQMHLQDGSVHVNGTLAYVAQQAWIFHGNIKENILFGKQFDKERYHDVSRACCLEADLASLPLGDMTEIGERGLNLSGGQKQRVSLARAVYADRDIYLLDDPLSAVDAHVGKHLFEECIQKTLKGKTVVLVTHQLQYLEFCDEILMLEDGRIIENGTHEELIQKNGRYTNLIHNFSIAESQTETEDSNSLDRPSEELIADVKKQESYLKGIENPAFNMSDERKEKTEAGKDAKVEDENELENQLVLKEEMQEGSVSWKTYHHYIKDAGGYIVSIIIMGLILITVAFSAFSNWWLCFWIEEGSGILHVLL